MITYKTFKRSATNWEEFGSARKITVNKGLTYEQALEACRKFNDNLTKAQKDLLNAFINLKENIETFIDNYKREMD